MNAIFEFLSSRGRHLFERWDGPLHFRLIMMPAVVSVVALWAGFRDAREEQPLFLRAFARLPAEHARLLRSAVAEIGRVFGVARTVGALYPLAVLRALDVAELLVAAVARAVVPYLILRGPANLLARSLRKNPPDAPSSPR